MPVEIDIASEYRYRNPIVGPDDLVIGISQSGETADTLAAMRLARERGARVLAITNAMGSQATREADGVLYTRAGPRDRRRRDEDLRLPGRRRCTCSALRLAELRGTLAPRAASPSSSASCKRCRHCIDELLERRRAAQSRRSPRALLAGRLLPLHRPPRRSADRARGGAEAEGDLLHLDRRLRGRRDEARADRAARRVARRSSASRPLAGARRSSSTTSRRCARAARR